MSFPNVPNVPGVPALPRLPGAVAAVVDLLVADALSLFSGFAAPEWGLFIDGGSAVTAESVVSFEFKQGFSISNFPVEGGLFESYNKVQRPFDVRLRFSTGGTLADRQELLASVAAAVNSLDLMDAVTPEATYSNVNPVHYDYRRTSVNGVGLLVVDVFCEQIRAVAASNFTNVSQPSASSGTSGTTGTSSNSSSNAPGSFNDRFPASISSPQSPSASPQVSGGTVQPQMPTPAQQTAIDGVISQSMLPF